MSKKDRPTPRPELALREPFPVGPGDEALKSRLGLTSLVHLGANENPLGAGELARAALSDFHLGMSANRYGDQGALRSRLVRHLGLEQGQVILGAGSDEVIFLAALTFLRPGDSVLTSRHDFIRYRHATEMMGATVREVPLREWHHDVTEIARAVDGTTRAIMLSNPMNPVGSMVSHTDIAWLMSNVPPTVLVLLDQAYHEYAEHQPGYCDALRLVARHPNLLVTRTFSKAHGLASLRVGYGFGAGALVHDIERVRPPHNVGRAAMVAAMAALEDKAHVARGVELNERGKRWFMSMMAGTGLRYISPTANFLLMSAPGKPAAHVARKLLEQSGVVVRAVENHGLDDWFRVTIGLHEENETFAKALRAAMGAESTETQVTL